MNKTELVKAVAEKTGASQVATKEAIEATLAVISETLKKGDNVQLIGFGSFAVKTTAARQGKNPRTGEVINIPSKKVAKFKAGAALI